MKFNVVDRINVKPSAAINAAINADLDGALAQAVKSGKSFTFDAKSEAAALRASKVPALSTVSTDDFLAVVRSALYRKARALKFSITMRKLDGTVYGVTLTGLPTE